MAATSSSLSLHKHMRVQRLGSVVIIQPIEGGAVAGPSVTIDLRSGDAALAEHPLVDEDYTEILGVLGLLRLHSTAVLAVITGAEQVATLRGSPVYKVTSTDVMCALQYEESEDGRYVELLQEGVSATGNGRTMYFSYGADVTLNTQRAAAVSEDKVLVGKPMWWRQDPRFFWNRALATPMLEGVAVEMSRFVVPVIMGIVRQLPSVTFLVGGEPREAVFTLIARRCVTRVGCRYWRRGIDLQGNVANFVESEQLIQFDSHNVASSFVQIRGSMPLMWSQSPNIKYKPPTYMAPVDQSQAAFDKHVSSLIKSYNDVTALNLANQHGSEGKLCNAFQRLATAFSEKHTGFRLVEFDFHKECGATNYQNLAKLWSSISDDFSRYGYYVTTPKGTVQQRGIFRTNCVDSLDRTNVVQGLLGRKHLQAHLTKLGALKQGQELAEAYPDFDSKFKNLWADHGDEISNQYAGTGALKSQFTRTGKRDVWGLLDDGKKSGVRYLLNNFRDGTKQDALDLVTGAHRIDPGRVFKFKHQPAAFYPPLMALAFVYIAVSNFEKLREMDLAPGEGLSMILRTVMVPLALAGGIMWLMSKYARRFVCTPQLRSDLVKVWERPAGARAAARVPVTPPAAVEDKKEA